jgi:uncharacterized repeat protein (TIGR03803 family)
VLDSAGNLYGTTESGGSTCFYAFECGTVFTLDPSGKEKVLYAFTGTNGDGASPSAGLIMDGAGNLYGTTRLGGYFDVTSSICSAFPNPVVGCGTVFKLDLSGKEAVLYTFTGTNGDGASPSAGLIMDSTGNLYGTTDSGGAAGGGTVFKLAPSGKETVLYSFPGVNENPSTGLIIDSAGNLYGTTNSSGAAGGGSVFKLDPSGKEAMLYSFPVTNGKGAQPSDGLIMDSAGNLYGTTSAGGSADFGTVFKLDPSGNETVLHSFTGSPNDGVRPVSGLIMDRAGNLYGTTPSGGVTTSVCPVSSFDAVGCGTVFKVDPSGNETVLYTFTGMNGDGAQPFAGSLIMDSAGNLYGTTWFGGSANLGTVFKLDPPGHETVLHSFSDLGDGQNPVAGLVMDSAGNLYGTTPNGGALGAGTVFKVDPSGNETVLYSFVGMNGQNSEPFANLILDSAGNLYGTTLEGGNSSSGEGTVFKVDPSGNETVLYTFTGMNGVNGDGTIRAAGLIMDSVGNLYGTTSEGGSSGGSGEGTLFRLTPSGKETVLYSFTGTNGDGTNPAGGLIMDSTGNLYGVTNSGGAAGAGIVFRLEPDFSFGTGGSGSTSATVTAGQTATYNLVLNSPAFSGSVSLTCSGAPAQAACSVSPTSATVSGASTVPFTVTVTTTAPTVMAWSAHGMFDSSSHGQRYTFLFACVLFAAFRAGTRRAGRNRAWVPIGSMVCLTIAMIACGNSSNKRGGGGGTPAGTYNLTVTGISQKVSHTIALTLTVNSH